VGSERSLEGKVALVTGSSRGIGAAIAKRLAADGARVGVHCQSNAAAATGVIDEISRAGGTAVLLKGSVGSPADCRQIVETAAARLGSIDILVNNAGSIRRIPFGKMTLEDAEEQFSTNVFSVLLMSQEAVRRFPATGGRIINISSNLALGGFADVSLYAAAKAAVITMTHCFAKELGARGITVNAVAPGGTETDMLADLAPAMRDYVIQNTPLGRLGRPSDIADVVAFLASDASRWITGCTIRADGGFI
jgi:3-oxoacyl-[acyl-carrier protein] reductase